MKSESNTQPSIASFPLEVWMNLRFNTHAATSVVGRMVLRRPSTSLSQVQVARRVKPHSSIAAANSGLSEKLYGYSR
jgi:hypothetical protein